MVKPKFHGDIVPFVTLFNRDYSIDFEAVRWLVRYQVSRGVHGVFPCSTTGEFAHLRAEECIELVKAVIEEAKNTVNIIPGISYNCTNHSIEIGRKVMDLGAVGIVITPPFFFKISRDELI